MTNIIVVFPKIDDATTIKNLLVRSGYQVGSVCTTGTKALNLADGHNDGIVVCGYKFSDMTYLELRENLPSGFEMLLLANQSRISEGIQDNVVAISMPLKTNNLVNTIEMLSMNIARRRRKQKQQPKNRNEDEKNIIENAKRVLMEKNGLSEEEAHRYIQKNSMDSGTNMVETAKMVIRIMLN